MMDNLKEVGSYRLTLRVVGKEVQNLNMIVYMNFAIPTWSIKRAIQSKSIH